MSDARRALPSVDRLLRDPAVNALLATSPRAVVLRATREALESARRGDEPPSDWAGAIRDRVARLETPSLRSVINATGVVLHTNLGRSPLPEAAVQALTRVAQGFSSLEFDLDSGTRGHRSDHCRDLLAGLAGAGDALVVNNAAGALLLALQATSAGSPVLISRGELIEIGGSFRIPEIIQRSGAELREIGTTNRTHLADYRRGLELGASAILTVHRSNFDQVGFVHTPEPRELAALAREFGVPYLYDAGSGLFEDLSDLGLSGEPRIPEAVSWGPDLVIFSGDKLLGGPQAGCLVGSGDMIARCRSNPVARAVRADKLTLAALEATLRLYLEPSRARREIPVLRMLSRTADDLAQAAADLRDRCPAALGARVEPGWSTVGGGSFPSARLPTTLVRLAAPTIPADTLARQLRLGDPAVVGRVEAGALVLDLRTVLPGEMDLLVEALEKAGGRVGG